MAELKKKIEMGTKHKRKKIEKVKNAKEKERKKERKKEKRIIKKKICQTHTPFRTTGKQRTMHKGSNLATNRHETMMVTHHRHHNPSEKARHPPFLFSRHAAYL